MTITVAIPSKGRMKEDTLATFAKAGLEVLPQKDARSYRTRVKGRHDIEIALLSASEIARELVGTVFQARQQVEHFFQRLGESEARQLSHFEPRDSLRITPSMDVETDRRLMEGIRGLRLSITGVHAKFKYGGNKTQEHRVAIAAALQLRNGPMDAAARRRVLSRKAPR